VTIDDQRLAKASRLLRRETGLRQVDLPTSRFVTQEIEAGRAGQLRVDVVVAHFAALGAKAQMMIRWNGAALDRLIDQVHAQVVNSIALILPRYEFRVRAEYTFNEYGERGSIDVFAAHDAARAVFVGEAKSEWGLARRDAPAARPQGTPCSEAGGRCIRLETVVSRQRAHLPGGSDCSTGRRAIPRSPGRLSGARSRDPDVAAQPERPTWRHLVPVRCRTG